MRVLYIDDEKTIRESMSLVLKTLGMEVDTAEDGQTAMEMLKVRFYDFVITDLGMPGMAGNQVVQAVKRHDSNLPVIVISGWSGDEVAKAFRNMHQPDQILQKPTTLDQMRNALLSLSVDASIVGCSEREH